MSLSNRSYSPSCKWEKKFPLSHHIQFRKYAFRLKQKDPDHSERPPSTRCDEPVDIIRVTVSVFVKRNIKGGNNRTANSRRANSRRGTKSNAE